MEMDMYFELHEQFKKKRGNLFTNVKLRRVCENIVAGERQHILQIPSVCLWS